MGVVKVVVLLFSLLLPTMAAAEVSDKISSIGYLLIQSILFALCALALAWFRWWLALLGFGLGALMLSGTWDLWHEPYLREAILVEQGYLYFVSAVVGDILVIIGALGGILLARRKQSTAL